MAGDVRRGTSHEDDRGLLVPVEFDALPFAPRRAFVVSATQGPASRGGHRADCRELLVLVVGAVTVTLRADGGHATEHRLVTPGDQLLVQEDVRVDYSLDDAGATLLVLADRPYVGRAAPELP